ncbi:MAG: hypothetical protein ACLVJ8_02635 [Ruthenibacterium lactatiformans]
MDHQSQREQQLPEQAGRALLAQDSAAADDKIDIFLIEADYALKYGFRLHAGRTRRYRPDGRRPVGQYPYTQDIATAGGKRRGVTGSHPGLFAYRRSIAKDVLGTDDPAQVQEACLIGTNSTL